MSERWKRENEKEREEKVGIIEIERMNGKFDNFIPLFDIERIQ